MIASLVTLAYLVAASLFIVGLKRMGSPRTARAGNRLAAIGMLVAVVAAVAEARLLNPAEVIAALAVGSAIGAWLARRTPLTEMPELVAAFNGFGGAASALVASAEVLRVIADPTVAPGWETAAVVAASVLIGAVTLSGSFVAVGKLRGRRLGSFAGIRLVSVAVGLGTLAAGAWFVLAAPGAGPDSVTALGALAVAALVLGVLLVLPIGGADMPVVVALLNAYSGLAAAATGFVLGNYALIVSGALVGASGLFLTRLMCRAMNRSLTNVLLGGFGADAAPAASAGPSDAPPVRATTPDDAAVMLAYAERVVIVPGYGLAVAQAQHEARELGDLLQAEGVEVRYAIHPVAGRMPGHMNVLLAEASVPYDQLVEMDEINADFPNTDAVLVVGANDVVNPAAREDPSSPIYGMPVLDVDRARQVLVVKRSMRSGYAGIENPLFHKANTQMLFGDAKAVLGALVTELKALQPA